MVCKGWGKLWGFGGNGDTVPKLLGVVRDDVITLLFPPMGRGNVLGHGQLFIV